MGSPKTWFRRALLGASLSAVAFTLSCAAGREQAAAPGAAFAARCAALPQAKWPDPSTQIVSATLVSDQPPGSGRHCEAIGYLQSRTGVDGQNYRIGFHLRLPETWNGRFLFQGGAGSNGALGDALARNPMGPDQALANGYAIVSQDSGHDNDRNNVAAHSGVLAFGFDPEARANYGHASLKVTADAAKAAIRTIYGRDPAYSYFVGCSKGGQEGMAFAQLYPDEFDGIIAAAPGFSLPRAAVAEAWSTQAFGQLSPTNLAAAFSDADLKLVADAVLAACDGDDGLKDGIVGAFGQCTTAKVHPELQRRVCAGAEQATCLSAAQQVAIERVNAGPRDSAGHALYSDWAWDPGLAAAGWRMWMLGGGNMPALNVLLGIGSLGAVFSSPPYAVGDLAGAMRTALSYDFDRDAAKIYAVAPPFTRSAWQDVGVRSPDLDKFRARGGKLIVPHGVADPVFSIKDTVKWYDEVDARTAGRAADFVRVFPVPGMNHCGGGPGATQFDAFTQLTAWVEHKTPPERIIATAGPDSPWPGRRRPLCPYPNVAIYSGAGSVEAAESFQCKAPAS